jgi:hypothetical protein
MIAVSQAEGGQMMIKFEISNAKETDATPQ